MEKSLFANYADKYFKPIVGKVTEKYNDQKTQPVLLHKTMLVEEYSPDLKWGSTSLNHSVVAADVVAIGSSLPLKSRGSIKSASGTLPKIGIRYKKDEKAISDIRVTSARGADEATIVSKIFNDVPKTIRGIDIRKEIMFLEALSTGLTLVEDDDTNDGTGIRVSFGYKAENTFHCTAAAWGEKTSKPQDDLQQLFDKANEDGNTIAHVYLSKKYFNFFRKSEQGIQLAAQHRQQVITDKSLLPVPSRKEFLSILEDEYSATFHVIDSAFKVEKPNGDKLTVRPWREANIVGTPDEVVGRLVYGTLAEEDSPVAGVSYQKSGSHILVSKYSHNEPALEEITAAQALCIPVLDGVEDFYSLHADATSTGLTLDKETVDAPKSASTKRVGIHYDGVPDDLTTDVPTAAQSWLTAAVKGDNLELSCSANTGAARNAEVTVTDSDGNTAKVTITQAAGA